MPLERLQKIIAASGKYSRRQAEVLIASGKVIVDGKKITQLGSKFDSDFVNVTVSGQKVTKPVNFQYVLLHKPAKYMVTRSDPEGRPTIYDLLPKKYHHLKPVGRLDYDSQGLVLLTNNGNLAQKMTHPQFHCKKVYEVKVHKYPGRRQLQRLQRGIMLDGRLTSPAHVEVIRENEKSVWLEMILSEGRNRQIRRMCEKVNLDVKTLIRKSIGPFKLSGIALGKWHEITTRQADKLIRNLVD